MKKLDRIGIHPKIQRGQPNIRGMDIGVVTILQWLAEGKSWQEIIDVFPGLEEGDIKQALLYSAHIVSGGTPVTPPEKIQPYVIPEEPGNAWDVLDSMIGTYENLEPLKGRNIPPNLNNKIILEII